MSRQRLRLKSERMEDRLVPAGALDTTFEADGVSVVDIAGTDDIGRAVAIQPDGRIVAVGSGDPNKNFVVARFNPDGSLDTSFSDDGKHTISFGAEDHATAVAIQPDGGIVIAGYTDANGDDDFAVVRLTTDGKLDESFSADGKLTISFGFEDRAAGVVIDGTTIVVVGANDGGSADFAIARLTADGTLDSSFSGDGKHTVAFGGADFATSVAVQNGKYVVAGYTDDSGSDQFAVLRLDADGSPDNTFDGDGRKTIDFGISTEKAAGVAIDGTNIVVVGSIVSAASSNFGIARLTEDGSLDNTFSFNGIQTVTFGKADFATAVAVQPDGRIVVGGYTDFNGDDDFAVARLEADGSLDDTFGGVGMAAAFLPGEQQAFALALQPDGRIVMAGSSNIFAGNLDLAVVRFAGDTAGLTVSITDGVGSVTLGGPVSYTILVSNAGPDVVTGAQLAGLLPAGLTGVTYVSVAAGGATGNTAAGAGAIADVLTLPAGASVVYTVSATVSAAAVGTLDTSATVTLPAGVFDPVLTDNTATDSNTIEPVLPPPPPPPPLTPPPPPPPLTPPTPVPTPFAAGMDVGGSSQVSGYNPDGSPRASASPFAGFTGGARVATADVTGDGVPDTIVAAGPGGAPLVKVLDGQTGAEVMSITPFEESFTGGSFVASADVNGDGFADLIITPDEGGGPRVRVISGQGGGTIADFFGIEDPAFRGGARAALADVNGDGVPDLLVAAGFGGGPRLAGFDGSSLASGPVKLFADFLVFENTLRNGVYVAAGDIDGDGFADVIAGGGPGGGPRVYAISGQGLMDSNGQTQLPLANFFAGNTDNRGGVRVSARELDGDGRADLVVGDGAGAGSRVTGYLGVNLSTAGTPPDHFAFDAFPGFAGGVYVG